MKVLLDAGISPRLRPALQEALGGTIVESAIFHNLRQFQAHAMLFHVASILGLIPVEFHWLHHTGRPQTYSSYGRLRRLTCPPDRPYPRGDRCTG